MSCTPAFPLRKGTPDNEPTVCAERHGPFLGVPSLFGHVMDRPRRERKERKTTKTTIVMKRTRESKVKMWCMATDTETVTRTHAQLCKPSYFHAKQRWSEAGRGGQPRWKAQAGVGRDGDGHVAHHCGEACTLGAPLAGRPRQRPGMDAASRLTPGKTVGEHPSNRASFGDYFIPRGIAFNNCLYTQRKPNRSLCLKILKHSQHLGVVQENPWHYSSIVVL